jgi:hypothetical protein
VKSTGRIQSTSQLEWRLANWRRVRGDISYDGSTDLYGIRNGSLTCIRYRDEILAPIVRLYAGAIGDDFILMDDNARPHRARIGNEYLRISSRYLIQVNDPFLMP